MAESYSVQAILSVVDKGFSSTLEKAGGAAKGLGNVAGEAGKCVAGMAGDFLKANLAADLIGKAIGAVKDQFSGFIGEMNQSNKAWQTFEGNMKMLGKSSTEIEQATKAMQDYATTTIYSASDMASTYGQMAAIGYDNVELLVKGMGGGR